MFPPNVSRPRAPLVIKAAFDRTSLTRRITFPDCQALSYELFKGKIAQCFCLSSASPSSCSPFKISYTDDDGDTSEIASEDDLSEAIVYFQSETGSEVGQGGGGGGGDVSVNGNGGDSGGSGKISNLSSSSASSKVVMRVFVMVEYDGPSLSETGSLSGGSRSLGSFGEGNSSSRWTGSISRTGTGTGTGTRGRPLVRSEETDSSYSYGTEEEWRSMAMAGRNLGTTGRRDHDQYYENDFESSSSSHVYPSIQVPLTGPSTLRRPDRSPLPESFAPWTLRERPPVEEAEISEGRGISIREEGVSGGGGRPGRSGKGRRGKKHNERGGELLDDAESKRPLRTGHESTSSSSSSTSSSSSSDERDIEFLKRRKKVGKLLDLKRGSRSSGDVEKLGKSSVNKLLSKVGGSGSGESSGSGSGSGSSEWTAGMGGKGRDHKHRHGRGCDKKGKCEKRRDHSHDRDRDREWDADSYYRQGGPPPPPGGPGYPPFYPPPMPHPYWGWKGMKRFFGPYGPGPWGGFPPGPVGPPGPMDGPAGPGAPWAPWGAGPGRGRGRGRGGYDPRMFPPPFPDDRASVSSRSTVSSSETSATSPEINPPAAEPKQRGTPKGKPAALNNTGNLASPLVANGPDERPVSRASSAPTIDPRQQGSERFQRSLSESDTLFTNGSEFLPTPSLTEDVSPETESSGPPLGFDNGLKPSQQPPNLQSAFSSDSESREDEDFSEQSSLHALSLGPSLPDEDLRCCACGTAMYEIRYICTLCGPLLPGQTHSDDGTAREGEYNESEEGGDSTPETNRGRPPGEMADLAEQIRLLPSVTDDASRDMRRDFSEFKGFELCVSCVETEGLKHALSMSKKDEEDLGRKKQILRHVFGEVMKRDEEWREVEFADNVTCSICGNGPIRHNRFKCLSCPKLELCLNCYRRVEEIHPIHVFQAVPDMPAPPPNWTQLGDAETTSMESESVRVTSQDMKEAILRARGVKSPQGNGSSNGRRGSSPTRPNLGPHKHNDIMCFGCLAEIVGPRYHCSLCPSFDLCARCESQYPPITSPDGLHDPSHILLKIVVPLDESYISDAIDRARELSQDSPSNSSAGSRKHRSRHGGNGSSNDMYNWALERENRQRWENGSQFRFHEYPYGPGSGMPPPHHFGHHFGFGPGPGHHWRRGPPPPPPVYLINANGMNPSQISNAVQLEPLNVPRSSNDHRQLHHVLCAGCDRLIAGVRWMCAQCPTEPSVSFCDDCEKNSSVLHDPLHSFLRLPRPLDQPLPKVPHLLPVLYARNGVSSGHRARGTGNDIELGDLRTAGANGIVHSSVICDGCLNPIRGAWMRCACCAESCDLCTDCVVRVEHDPRHVFIKLSKSVDMSFFKELTNLSSPNPRPLLGFFMYEN